MTTGNTDSIGYRSVLVDSLVYTLSKNHSIEKLFLEKVNSTNAVNNTIRLLVLGVCNGARTYLQVVMNAPIHNNKFIG